MSEEGTNSPFIRNEGLGPIKSIVERGEAHKEMLEVKRPRQEETVDAVADNNAEPTFEPNPDTNMTLNRIGNDNVYKRGGFRRLPSDRNPYENNN